jgi:HK97 family phage portal protein
MGVLSRYLDRLTNTVDTRAFVPGPGVVDPAMMTFGVDPEVFTPERYADYLATSNGVYACAKLRATLLSSLPLKHYRIGTDGARVEVTGGRLFELTQKVNKFWTFNRLIEMTELSLSVWGSCFWFLERGQNGRQVPSEIWWARPDRVRVVPHPTEYVSHFLYEPANGSAPIRFERDEVVWLRYSNPIDEYSGLSPLAAARVAADVSNAAMKSNRNLFAQGIQMGGLVMPTGNTPLTEDQAKQLEESLTRRFRGVDKAHRWGVMRIETKFQPMSLSPKDAEFMGAMATSLEDIARAYGVPQDLVGGQRTYENVQAAMKILWQHTIVPEARFIATELTEQLLPMFSGADGADVCEFDLSEVEVLKEDQHLAWTIAKEQLAAGVLTINRYLEEKGEEPVAWGDVWWASAGLQPVASGELPLAPMAEPAILEDAQPAPSEDVVLDEQPQPRGMRGIREPFVPTDEMAAEAERGLRWREEYGRGGTEVGVARARDISNKRALSLDTVQRMASYFARHEVDKEGEGWSDGQDGYPSAGRIAWALWGGDPARAWAERILGQEEDSGRSVRLAYGSDEHRRLWDAHVRALTPGEERIQRLLGELFRRQQRSVLDTLRQRGVRNEQDALEDPFDLARWTRVFRVAIRPELNTIAEEGGTAAAATLSEAAAGFAFDLQDPNLRRVLERQAQRFAEQVNETTWTRLKDELQLGLDAGEGTDLLAQRVEAVMGDRIRSSAQTIARTETTTAYNAATVESYKQSGVVGGKRWLAALDERTRETHIEAHDQVVPLEDNFVVGGSEGPAPGEIGVAEEDINCRCAITAVLKEDMP